MKEILKAVQDLKVKTESIKKHEKFRDLKGDLRGKLHQQNKRHGKRISEIEDTIGGKRISFSKKMLNKSKYKISRKSGTLGK